MCDLFGKAKSVSTATVPTYTPPSQSVSSGPTTPGVQVRGSLADTDTTDIPRRGVRRVGGSNGQVDSSNVRRQRSASAGLGL